MTKHTKSLLLVPIMVSLSCGNVQANGNNSGLIAGACAVGAAVLGAIGIAAAVDWCYSETDDQLINRAEREWQSIYAQYAQTMSYFGPRAGVGIHMPHRPIQYIPEDVLYEFGTSVWNSNMSQSAYRSDVWSARTRLQSCARDLNKRIAALVSKHLSYEDQKRVSAMRNVLGRIAPLLADISLFADCLECHKTYFTLYDSVGHIRNRYLQHITILESGRYSTAAEIKNYVLNCDSSKYSFMHFVKNAESDIATLQSDLYALSHNYDAAQKYTQYVINQLMSVKSIVALDPRYREELYQWEQERLELARIEAMQAQARLERERIKMLERQNRILEERNRLEREKMYARQQQVVIVPAPILPVVEEFEVTFNF